MESRISIREIGTKIQIKFEKKITKNIWKTILKTEDPEIIHAFIKEILEHIASISHQQENLIIKLSDDSTITIHEYQKLRENPLIKPIKRELQRRKGRERRKNYARALLVSAGILAGLVAVSKKDVKAESVSEQTIETDENMDASIKITKPQELLLAQIEEMQKELEKEKEAEKQSEETEPIIPTYSYEEFIPSLGTQANDERITEIHENYGELVEKYAAISGIDASIIECILAQEGGKNNGEVNASGAIGIAQIQYNQHIGGELTLYNKITGETEEFTVTQELLQSTEGNLKTGVAILQSHLDYFHGNIFLAVQAYNYGRSAMNKVLENTVERTGISRDELLYNPLVLTWIEDVQSYRNGNYGDPNYLDKVFSRYNENILKVVYQEEPTLINLEINTNTNEKSR